MHRHPILSAGIDDSNTCRPSWAVNNNNNNPPSEPGQPRRHPILDNDIYPVACVADVAKAEDRAAQAFNLAQGPLWRVATYRLERVYPHTHYIALTIHHAVTDGTGALNLFREVLRQPPGFSATPVVEPPVPRGILPPKAEDTIRIRPSALTTVRRGASWALNHKPLWRVTRGIGARVKWPPSGRLRTPPGESDIRYVSLDLRKEQRQVAERLEALGDGIGSVHSVLHTAAVVALAAAAHDDVFDTINTETPKSLRSDFRTHPRIGGNYTGLVEKSFARDKLNSHTVASFTKKFNDYLHSSGADDEARSNVGEFRLAPDRYVPDLWKFYLEEAARSDNPYRHSLSISNLGRFDPKDTFGMEEVWFCHSSSPWGSAINLSVVSLSPPSPLDVRGRKDFSRMTITVSWNAATVERTIIDRFCQLFEEVVIMWAHAGGQTHSERELIRSRELLNMIAWARAKPV